MRLGLQYASVEKCARDPSGVAVACSQQFPDLASWQFAAVKNRLQDCVRLWRKGIRPDFLFRPDEDPIAQTTWFDEAFHEPDLVDAGGEEESRELDEGLFAQMPATVQIVG